MFDPSEQQPRFGASADNGALAPAPQHHLAFQQAGHSFDQESGEEGFSAVTLLFRVLQYRRFIASMLALGIAAGIMITALEPSRYDAGTRIEILPQNAKIIEDFQVMREQNDDRTLLTARERILSKSVGTRVVFDLALQDNMQYLARSAGFSLGNIVNRAFRLDNTASIRRLDYQTREGMAVGRLRSSMTVRPVTGTNILEIIVRDEDPRLAAAVADQVAKSYIDQRIDQTNATSTTARGFIQEQVGNVKARLEEAEKQLVDYAREQHLNLTESNGNLVQTELASINAALLDAQKKRIADENLMVFIKQGRGGDLPQVLENKAIQDIRAKIADLKGQYQENLSTMKPAMPEMRQLANKIQELDRQASRAIGIITDSIQLTHTQIVEQEKALQKRLSQLETAQTDFQDKNIRYTILKREVDSYRTQYQNLISKLNDVGVSSEIRTPSAAITDLADVPGRPASPSLTVNLLAALVLTSILTGLIIYVIELLNNTFARPEQIDAELGIPLLGILPNIKSSEIIEQLESPTSGISEAYRSLRTSLQFTGQDGTPRTIAITSSEPSEGKSTTVFKLARDLAALGARVLVVDADLRKPSMHRLFGTDHAVGLSNLLTNSGHAGDIQSMFRSTKYANVSFISSGTLPPNPADLLSSSRMAMVVNLCSKAFDIVLIDCPPVIGLADAPVISRLAEGTLIVVSAHQVTRKSVRTALKRIRAIGGVPLGAALTKFTVDRFDYNYAYRYMYYNSYYRYGANTPSLEAPTNDEAFARDIGQHSSMAGWTRRARGTVRRFLKRYQQVP